MCKWEESKGGWERDGSGEGAPARARMCGKCAGSVRRAARALCAGVVARRVNCILCVVGVNWVDVDGDGE